MKCEDCIAYVADKSQCHRYPNIEEKLLNDWCLEFRAKEVAHAIEKREIAESGVGKHQGTDALRPTTEASGSHSDEQSREVKEEKVKHRGWPKGKQRK